MITAPSTISPKSIAPSDIKLPLTLPCTMAVAVMSMESGMASAQMKAARTFPSRNSSTTITRIAPSARFFCTVAMVASTSFVRFSTVFARTSCGSERCTVCIFASTSAATVRLFAPSSMMAVETTTSWPFSLADPVRNSCPMPTCAPSGSTSRTLIGTPPRVAITISSTCSGRSIRPVARTR